jgi:predicted aldo/keto reductase-like oxidoreductase
MHALLPCYHPVFNTSEEGHMQYTNFGNSGLVVSRLSFGAMTFGEGTLVGDLVNRIDQTQADRMVGMALDAGINCFDTADMYTNGQSEQMLGKAMTVGFIGWGIMGSRMAANLLK